MVQQLVPFIDIETTGLDHNDDLILEVAMLAVTPSMEIVHTYEAVIGYPMNIGIVREGVVPFVQEMHDANGLWAEVSASRRTIASVEDDLIRRYSEWFGKEVQLPMYGSSLRLDRAFLDVSMRRFHEMFHYRSVDVSSIKELAKIYAPAVAAEWDEIQARDGDKSHRALGDAISSLEELKFYVSSMRNGWWLHPREVTEGRRLAPLPGQRPAPTKETP